MPVNNAVTRTIRIEKDVDESLRTFADREGISVNLLVNKAIRRLVEWDVYAEKFGMVALPGSLLQKMMDELTDEEAAELGRWVGENLLPDFLTFWFKEVSLQSVALGYPRLTSRYGRVFKYEEQTRDGTWTVVLKHNGGTRWSLYYEALLRAALGKLVKKEDLVVETTDDQVLTRFALP